MAGVVVLDAGALIALFDSTDPHHPWALELFIKTAGDDLIMSTLTYAEVLVRPLREGRVEKFESSISGLGITLATVTVDDARQLAGIRVATNLKMPDAVILAVAEQNVGAIATTDASLARAASERGVTVYRP
jgi:predicted nucleic acid-binding protein